MKIVKRVSSIPFLRSITWTVVVVWKICISLMTGDTHLFLCYWPYICPVAVREMLSQIL